MTGVQTCALPISKGKGVLLSTGTAKQKAAMLDAAHALHNNGYSLYATGSVRHHDAPPFLHFLNSIKINQR